MLNSQKGRVYPALPAGGRQAGFAPLILIIVVLVLVGTGVFVWRSQKNSTTPSSTPSSTPSPTLPTNIPEEAKTLVQLAINEVAKQALVDPSKVQIISVEKMEWSDGSLGCPKPGMFYTQAIVPGYLIILEANGRRLEYHTDNGQLLELCSQSQTSDISSWKTFTTSGINSGLTLKYPQNWVTPDNIFISEKPFVAGQQDRSKIYNIIEIQKYSTQIYTVYTNSEWFNKISSLIEPMSDQRETRTKISSGNVASGEPFVIFKNEPSAPAGGGAFKQVKAYILKDQIIYQLTLDLYNNNGLEVFKKAVPTAIIN